jgi:hypothetical protein
LQREVLANYLKVLVAKQRKDQFGDRVPEIEQTLDRLEARLTSLRFAHF